MVPTPWLSAIVAFVAADKFTLNVSGDSSFSKSLLTVMLTGWEVCPGVKVTVPLAAT